MKLRHGEVYNLAKITSKVPQGFELKWYDRRPCVPSHCAILPAGDYLRGAYQKFSGSSAEGNIRCTQGERLPTFCGEVTFTLSLEGWGWFGPTNGSKNGR